MKKLMTMIAAVGMAFGLFADGITAGTSFEVADKTGPLVGLVAQIDELGSAAQASLWDFSALAADATAAVEEMPTATGEYPTGRSKKFGEDNGKFLLLKTGSAALTRYIDYVDSEFVKHTVTTAGTIWFDSQVKFTAFDGQGPEFADGYDGKLAVYLQDLSDADEAVAAAETNLMIKVGTGDPIVIGNRPALLDTWHRVTIKAVKMNETQMGFVVFIDKTMVTSDNFVYTGFNITDAVAISYKNDKALIPFDGNTIEGVSFQGQGSVDDLVFTTDFAGEGFAGDPDVVKVTFNTTYAEGVSTNENGVLVKTSPAVFPAGDVTGNKIWYKGAGNYVDGWADVNDGEVTINNAKLAAAFFKDKKFGDLGDAVDAANDADSEGTLKLIQAGKAAQIESNYTITLDLNGLALETLVAISDVVVTGNGSITEAISGEGDVTIKNGTFDCLFEDFDGTVNVEGGKFKNMPAKVSYPTGKKFVPGTGDDEGYFVLGDITYVTLTVTTDEGVDTLTITNAAGASFGDGAKFDVDVADVLYVDCTLKAGKKIKGTAPATSYTMDKDQTIAIATEDNTFTVSWAESKNVVVSNGTEEVSGTSCSFVPNTVLKFYATEGTITNVTVNGTAATAANPFGYTVTNAATLVVLAGKEETQPVVDPIGKKSVDVTADSPENAIKQVKMKEMDPPAGADVTKEDYNAYFELKAVDLGNNKYRVYADLTDDIVKAAQETTALAGRLTEISAATESQVPVTVTNAKSGLYYSVIEGQQVTGRQEGERTLAKASTVTIKTTKFEGSGFYQIQVSATDTGVVGQGK